MEMSLTLTPDQVPSSYAVCFHFSCPQKENCMRFLAGKAIAEKRQCGLTVYPAAYESGTCSMYKQSRIFTAAYGFNKLFSQVRYGEVTKLREALKQYLGGHGTYYRYHKGDNRLTPEQQTWIINLFAEHGSHLEFPVDHYSQQFDFSD